jgi:hypothetical protein
MLHILLRRSLILAAQAALLGAGCAGARPPASAVAVSAVDTTSAEVPAQSASPAQSETPREVDSTECTLACEAPQMVPRPAAFPDYTQREIDDANEVLGAMHDDLLACYKKRVRVRPEAHGFITVDIVVGSDGRVAHVDTTGGALLGDGTMQCIVARISRGAFEPPHGGGTVHVRVPFSLRRVAPGEDP